MKPVFVVVLVGMLSCIGADGNCQPEHEPADQAEAAGEAEANPTRAVLFSIRPEFYAVNGDVRQSSLILRYDYTAFRQRRWLPGKRGVVLRVDAPITAARGSASRTRVGLGDTYAHLLLTPYLTSRFAWVVGSGIIAPTATDEQLGGGKWLVAPATGPLWFLRGGLAFVKVQSLHSVAGDAQRPDVRALLITPLFMHTLSRRTWLLVDSESKTNLRPGGRTDLRSGVQVGWALKSAVGLWVKPEIWWGPNRNGRWNLKTGIVWYRLPPARADS
jgi:hypothetical protein